MFKVEGKLLEESIQVSVFGIEKFESVATFQKRKYIYKFVRYQTYTNYSFLDLYQVMEQVSFWKALSTDDHIHICDTLLKKNKTSTMFPFT